MVPPRYLFDRWGTCLACIDDAERFVDRDGRPLGQVVRNGKVYDGDGRYDPTVFRPSAATWYSQRSTAGTLIQQFGASGDRPIPNAFVP